MPAANGSEARPGPHPVLVAALARLQALAVAGDGDGDATAHAPRPCDGGGEFGCAACAGAADLLGDGLAAVLRHGPGARAAFLDAGGAGVLVAVASSGHTAAADAAHRLVDELASTPDGRAWLSGGGGENADGLVRAVVRAATATQPPISPAALAAGGALLAGGAVRPDSAEAEALVAAAFRVWAGGDGHNDAPPLEAGGAAGRVVSAGAAVRAPALAARLAGSVATDDTGVAVLEAVCVLAGSSAGRALAVASGAAAAAGRAFRAWWGCEEEGEARPSPSPRLVGCARQRALDAALALVRHGDGLAAFGGGGGGDAAAAASAGLLRTARRLWRVGGEGEPPAPPHPRDAAAAAALTAAAAAGATDARLEKEAAAWARLPGEAVDGLLRCLRRAGGAGGEGEGAAAAAAAAAGRGARQAVAAWAALAASAPAALAASPWAASAASLLAVPGAPAVRQAGAAALAVAATLATRGHCTEVGALAAAAVRCVDAACDGSSRAAADAAADALAGLADWLDGPLRQEAAATLAAGAATLPAWARAGLARGAHPALAAAAGAAAAALARSRALPSSPPPSVWLTALAASVTARVNNADAAPADALSGAGEGATAAALDAAAAWLHLAGGDRLDSSVATALAAAAKAAAADGAVDGDSPQLRAARALGKTLRACGLLDEGTHQPGALPPWEEEEDARQAVVVIEKEDADADADDLLSLLHGLNLAGGAVGGPQDCV